MTTATRKVVRLAAASDLHVTKTSQGALQPLVEAANEQADVLLLCGDLTDYGLPDEARMLAKELSGAHVPIVAVLGNHDFESEQPQAVAEILCDAGLTVLDGEGVELMGIGFAGAKGFAGGFDRHSLEPWGEPMIKSLVREAVDEALKLEKAVSRLHTPQRVVLLHYAPIKATVEGEPCEIHPFLGSSRLEEPINRHEVSVVFHGHAHYGTAEGKTSAGIPVYNVSVPLLRRDFPDKPPFRLVELPVEVPAPV